MRKVYLKKRIDIVWRQVALEATNLKWSNRDITTIGEKMKKFEIDDLLRIFHEQYVTFFKKCNQQSPSNVDFACKYYDSRIRMLDSIRIKFGVEATCIAQENEWQIGVAALLGLQHDLCPAILHLNNPNQAVAMLFKFLKYDQFPSLYYEDLHVALKAITQKTVTNYIVGNWYHCLQEIGILYDQLFPSSGYYDNFDLKRVNKVKRLVKKHYLSDVQTRVQRHLVRSERSLVNSQKKYEKIVVYRGFCVRPNESVRLNRSLRQNPQCFTQDAGAGINYTLDRDLAEEFARHPFTKIAESATSKPE